MAKQLVIVESPAKARTLTRILGRRYTIKASVGHVRDLPKSRLGVDVDDDFTPKYTVPKEKKAIVKELKEAAKEATSVYLATDPDREGEAISWHLTQVADIAADRARRVVFHEITPSAVEEAFQHPRTIDLDLVNAQQTRRILDRLVGYKLSPILWRKVRRGLSAGRVQSVALKMIVDREREIEAFVVKEYWTIEAELAKQAEKAGRRQKRQAFTAALRGPVGQRGEMEIGSGDDAQGVVSALSGAGWAVADVRRKESSRQPSPPFITSTLQQEAARKLRFTPKRTMAVAQQLYEGLSLGPEGEVGLITYMRTDSTRLASSALDEARAYIEQRFGKQYVPPKPRVFRKAKAAQDAHEAIRPTSVLRDPERVKPFLSSEQYRLYDLIWKRMVASQMAAARIETVSVDIHATPAAGTAFLFRATGSTVKFPGFLEVYAEGRDDESEDKGRALPEMAAGEALDLLKLTPSQHFTQPPPRYSDATLVAALEENAIGRPSTYAPILSTIQERGYVERVERRFKPTELGIVVSDLLAERFPDVVNIGFTARMEKELDDIARGERQWVPVLREFYGPLSQKVEQAEREMPKVKLADELAGEDCDQCGRPMIIKLGRFGRFIACSGFPECRNAKPLLNRIGVPCPKCSADVVERRTRKGRRIFYGCSRYPECDFTSWNRPLAERCPNCGGTLTVQRNELTMCINCGFSRKVDKAQPVGAASEAG